MMTNKDFIVLTYLFPYVDSERSLKNKADIEFVVTKPAYNDMSPRTLKGIGEKQQYKDKMFAYLVNEFEKYFSNKPPKDKSSFDQWHEKVCNGIIQSFDGSGINIKIGKAQKIVNMSFKHFLLFGDSKGKIDYFKYCHTPIDNNVLKWCREEANIQRSYTWSNLNYNDYIELQEQIRKYLDSPQNTKYKYLDESCVSNLVLDYYIWVRYGDLNSFYSYWKDNQTKSDFYNENTDIIERTNNILSK
jgi:hypothetical protein